ncbi:MAG: hypothetical protein JSV27_04435 [Candidatus Bathyarchaeota archaeon]|nr:MAG: hypothetical protein JSV27_04435 [Candidatus Bathyarchaeota archaeon]
MSIRSILTTIFYFFKIFFTLPLVLWRYYFGRKGAVRRFKKELISSGVPRKEANELAQLYPFKLSEVWELARETRGIRASRRPS